MSEAKSTPSLCFDSTRTAIVVIDLQNGIASKLGGVPHTKPVVIANTATMS